MLDFSLARVFEWPLDVHSEIYTYVFPKVLYPLNNIIFNTSIGLTVVVAFERYGFSTISGYEALALCAIYRPHIFLSIKIGLYLAILKAHFSAKHEQFMNCGNSHRMQNRIAIG